MTDRRTRRRAPGPTDATRPRGRTFPEGIPVTPAPWRGAEPRASNEVLINTGYWVPTKTGAAQPRRIRLVRRWHRPRRCFLRWSA